MLAIGLLALTALTGAAPVSGPLRDREAEAGLSARDSSSRIDSARVLGREGAVGSAAAVRSALRGEKDPRAKAVLVGTLGLLKPDSTILPELEAALKDKNVGVRLEAVGALGRLSDANALQDLISALKSDSDANVRQLAALRLTGTRDDSAVDALVSALTEDPDPGVRMQAVFALGSAPQRKAKDALEQAKRDSDARVQKAAKAVARS